jgi:hypothetical protein
MLGRVHALGPRRHGQRGLEALLETIGGRGDALVAETVDFVAVYGPQTESDYAAFVGLLEEHGTNLGYLRR